MGQRDRASDRRRRLILYAAFWLVAVDLCLRTLDIRNDQFGRLAPGRQILVFGELPFRDFLDPGYFLTEFSSAAVQWLLGQNLLGEVLLNSAFIATGCLFVCLAARRLGAGLPGSIVAGAFALLAMPRAYDYDKVLLYPFATWLTLRWLERPTRGRALALAAGLVVAALYRYDNGVFLGLSALAGVTVLAWGDRRRFLTTSTPLALTLVCLCVPVLGLLAATGGIGNAVDQSLTYGLRESARTRISSVPRVHAGSRLLAVNPSPPSQNHVLVRWAQAAVAPEQRRPIAMRLGLEGEQQSGPTENRTFSYTLPDASPARVRQLVNDPQVEDTDGIDRRTLTLLEPEPWWLRLERLSPVLRLRVLPDAWTTSNGEAVLYDLLTMLPLVAIVSLVWQRRADTSLCRAQVVTVVVLCVLLDLFILRDPISARVGGMAGPFAALGAYLAAVASRSASRAWRLAIVFVALLAAWGLAVAVEWPRQLSIPFGHPQTLQARLTRQAATPPDLRLLPNGRISGMVGYLRNCTTSSDRAFVSWFVPELFYFAQRGFGGAMAATFGGHWSEPRFQRRSIEALESHPTPIVIIQNRSYAQFRDDYPMLDAYLATHYRPAGVTDFGDRDAGSDAYRVLVRTDRRTSGTDGRFGLPCFSAPQSL